MKVKKYTKVLARVLFPLSVLSLVPILMSATGEIKGNNYEYQVLLEIKEGSEATQTSENNVLSLSSEDFYKLALSDNTGIASFLTLTEPNIQLELFKKSAPSSYNSVVSTERLSVESQRETYIEQFGETEGESRWQANLENQGYTSTEDFIYRSSRQKALNAAFQEIYDTRDVTETDDKGTPDDKSDDTTESFKLLSNNQLYWFDYWYKRERPVHIGEISFTIDSNDDYRIIESMQVDKLTQFLDILKVQGADAAVDPINFSGLSSFSSGSAEDGNLGILTLTNNVVSDSIAKNNIYSFINDTYNGVDVSSSIINLNNITNGEDFLKLFEDGDRNYKVLNLRNGREIFVVSRTASGFSIYKIFGISKYIRSSTRDASYKDYFLDSVRNFNNLTIKPFDISATLNSFISNIPNNYFSLASANNYITFDNGNLISGEDLEARINTYLNNLHYSNIRSDYEVFINNLETLNEGYQSGENKSQINPARLNVNGNWGVWL